MFDKLTKKMAEKMGKSVRQAAEPIRTEVKKTVDSKVDLYSRLLRLGVLVFLFIEGTKRISDPHSEPMQPSQIIINNYLDRKDGDS